MGSDSTTRLPRVAITYCTQCKWLLRAAYFAQELLSTFETAIGEIALLPSTGGTFHIVVSHASGAELCPVAGETGPETRQTIIWDRKSDGGFPETKVLKQRLRDVIQPGRSLGHSDKKPDAEAGTGAMRDGPAIGGPAEALECKDC